MLKITAQTDAARTTFELEGRLSDAWVHELKDCWLKAANSDRQVRVMLCAVTFIDDKGRDLLVELHRQGADLVAAGCMNNAIVVEFIRGERR